MALKSKASDQSVALSTRRRRPVTSDVEVVTMPALFETSFRGSIKPIQPDESLQAA